MEELLAYSRDVKFCQVGVALLGNEVVVYHGGIGAQKTGMEGRNQ